MSLIIPLLSYSHTAIIIIIAVLISIDTVDGVTAVALIKQLVITTTTLLIQTKTYVCL